MRDSSGTGLRSPGTGFRWQVQPSLLPTTWSRRVFVLCYFLISATYRPQLRTSTADTEIYQAQPQSYTTEPDLGTKGIVRVPSSAGEEPERGRTVKRFRCPLRLPVRHKLSLRAIAAVSDGDLQAQTSGPPATDPETPIDYLSILIQYLLSIAQHYCHLQYSRDLAHEFLDPTRWP